MRVSAATTSPGGRPDERRAEDTGTLLALPEPRLRDLAWWTATQAARHAGLDGDPDVAASLRARALTPAHERQNSSRTSAGGLPASAETRTGRASHPSPDRPAELRTDGQRSALLAGQLAQDLGGLDQALPAHVVVRPRGVR
jgi:hypothetical protein